MYKSSEIVKLAGLKSLKRLSDASGVSEQTLLQWREKRSRCFRLMILGASIDEFMLKMDRLERLK